MPHITYFQVLCSLYSMPVSEQLNIHFIFGQLAFVGKDSTAPFQFIITHTKPCEKHVFPVTFVYHDASSPGDLFSSHTSSLFRLAPSACAAVNKEETSHTLYEQMLSPHPFFTI